MPMVVDNVVRLTCGGLLQLQSLNLVFQFLELALHGTVLFILHLLNTFLQLTLTL